MKKTIPIIAAAVIVSISIMILISSNESNNQNQIIESDPSSNLEFQTVLSEDSNCMLTF